MHLLLQHHSSRCQSLADLIFISFEEALAELEPELPVRRRGLQLPPHGLGERHLQSGKAG